MHERDFLVQRKKQLERLLFPTQHQIEEYEREKLQIQEAYDNGMKKFSWLQGYSNREERFHDDILAASFAFSVGIFPKIIGDFGIVDVSISSFIGLSVCGGLVLLRNQPHLTRRNFGDLDDLVLSIYDNNERLKGISSAISSLKPQFVTEDSNSSAYNHGAFHKEKIINSTEENI